MAEWGENKGIDDDMINAEEKEVDQSVYYKLTCQLVARKKTGNRVEKYGGFQKRCEDDMDWCNCHGQVV